MTDVNKPDTPVPPIDKSGTVVPSSSTPLPPLANANDLVKDNTAQGLDTKKQDAIDKIASAEVEDKPIHSSDILKQIKTILAEHDNKEADIPVTHGYWHLLNLYRRLRSNE